MTDVFDAETRSAVMRAVAGRGTAPELAIRRLIWSLGGRYRLNLADLPGKPDLVLAGCRLAIFVHGCFWHGHHCKRGARVPKANRDYWQAKIGRNRERDARVGEELQSLGWRAEVIWECELKDLDALRTRCATLLAITAPRPRRGGRRTTDGTASRARTGDL